MMSTERTLQILGVVRSGQLQYELTEAIGDHEGTTVDLRVGDLGSLGAGLLRNGRSADVLLLDVDVHDADEMEVFDRLTAEAAGAKIPVVATAGTLCPASVRRLIRDGVTDFLPQPIERDEVLEVLRAADHKARQLNEPGPARGRVLAFSRASGGAGATTLAVNLAHALAEPRRRSRAKVCLIDLDLQFGTVALQLDLCPSRGLLELARMPERPDAAAFLSALVEHPNGLHVLTAPDAPMSLEALRPDLVAWLLALARAEFDYVVVDLPIAQTKWTATVLAQSDLIFLVTQLNVPAVRQLRKLLDLLETTGLEDLPLQLVLNRHQRWFGWGAGIRRRQAEAALGRGFDHCFADQFDVLIEAANRGRPAIDLRRYSRFGRQLRRMLKRSLAKLGPPVLPAAAATQ
jgi:pilus assembly protein CpaE